MNNKDKNSDNIKINPSKYYGLEEYTNYLTLIAIILNSYKIETNK